MKFKNLSTKRRGLSSVVGALLFVVLMVSTFSVLGVALNSQTDIVSTGRDMAAKDLEKQQEAFQFVKIQQDIGEDLKVNLINQGQNTAEMFTMIMTNKSHTGEPTRTFEIPSETSFLPAGANSPTNIVETLDLKMDLPTPGPDFYDFKVISSLGTVKTLSVECDQFGFCGTVTPPAPPGTPGLSAQIFMDGPAINGKTSTIFMFVQNTGSVPLEDVHPVDEVCLIGTFPIIPTQGGPVQPGLGDFTNCISTPSYDGTCGSGLTGLGGKNDGDGICLVPGQTILFKWDGTVEGDVGDIFEFCNQVQGQEYDDTPVGPTTPPTCDRMEVINPNDCGGAVCESGGPGDDGIILIDDLLIKPSIFMTIPSPFGNADDGDGKGLWGVNVANPTDRDMSISKVTIVAYPPGGNAADIVFSGTKNGPNQCLEEDILPLVGPSPGGYWDCPRDNSVMWQNFTSPISLPANSTKSFMLKAQPGEIFGSNTNLDALIVQANVYSTFGSFGKSGYQSTMYESDAPIVNVYLTDAVDLRTGFIANLNDIGNYTSTTFNAVLADLDDNEFTYINIGAQFIINVPREWTFENFISCEGFEDVGTPGICDGPNEPSVTVHSDGSTQIIGTSINKIGDGTTPGVTDPSEARKISFKVTSAPVKVPRLYVMYILADGVVSTPDGDRTIGPLSEIVLNVDP